MKRGGLGERGGGLDEREGGLEEGGLVRRRSNALLPTIQRQAGESGGRARQGARGSGGRGGRG